MNMTSEEKLMYQVMKSIYDSGIPVDFKGSMVLKVCLTEAGFKEETRHTVDIDANWNCDEPPTIEQMTESLQRAIDRNMNELKVSPYRQYGEKRSAGFEIRSVSSNEMIFTMDIDVNRPMTLTKIYEINGMRFRGVVPLQMIADKVCVVSSEKIFRRIKDLVDLYYLSKVFEFDKKSIMEILENGGRTLDSFNAFIHRRDELKHAYDKFRIDGDVYKPEFETVYHDVNRFIKTVIPREKNRDYER